MYWRFMEFKLFNLKTFVKNLKTNDTWQYKGSVVATLKYRFVNIHYFETEVVIIRDNKKSSRWRKLPVWLYQNLRWEKRKVPGDWSFLWYGKVSIFHHWNVSGFVRWICYVTRRLVNSWNSNYIIALKTELS